MEVASRPQYRWKTVHGLADHGTTAVDGSKVRQYVRTPKASIVHCTLPRSAISRATRNVGIEEVWIVTGGMGELWRREGDEAEVAALREGVCVTIPEGVDFQFRSLDEPLTFLCITMPPWPGPHANQPVSSQRWDPGGIATTPTPER